MRRAARKDDPQPAIVQALRRCGVAVFVLNNPGLPDLLCFDNRHRCAWGYWVPVEVKRPKGKLTTAQKATQRIAQFPVVTNIQEALGLFGVTL